ncbi:MAG TPA: hypothetical protein VGF95_04285 [Solirubrobacteraceae bacterium]|jgi:hypothetical protein
MRENHARQLGSALKYLDVAAVVVALVLGLVFGAPAFGLVVGAVAWVLQRVLAYADSRWIRRASEPGRRAGLNLFEAFGRIWLLAGAIVIAGVAGSRADGLTAALVIFGAYSIAFAIKVFNGLSAGSVDVPSARSAAAANRLSERASAR